MVILTMSNLYRDIAERTGGNIYIGVVGPVRTGKSTFIKRLMEELVIPNIEDLYQRERARDELPQSGSGRTIMTAEPKFIPEEAVEITPDGTAALSVRLIDSVGYMVEGAVGAMEGGEPRMVTTPWFNYELPMTQAAELGTRKVMEEHCTLGIVVTTDGTVTDIPRSAYIEAEEKAILDMKATGKPFLVLVNSKEPKSPDAAALRDYIAKTYAVSALTADCQSLKEEDFRKILTQVLYAFPMREMRVFLPAWVQALDYEDPLKCSLYEALRVHAEAVSRLAEAEASIKKVCELDQVCGYRLEEIDLGTGTVTCELEFNEGLFYQTLGRQTGFEIEDDGQLLSLLKTLSEMKKQYDRISSALEEVRATGYGIVMPSSEEMHMETPEIVKKGGAYGVRLRASAPSIHMMRADIKTEISPMVGNEQQSEELVKYLLGEYEDDTEKLWESNIFGKSVFELVNEGLTAKLRKMPEDARYKLKDALTKIVNQGANGLICLLL